MLRHGLILCYRRLDQFLKSIGYLVKPCKCYVANNKYALQEALSRQQENVILFPFKQNKYLYKVVFNLN